MANSTVHYILQFTFEEEKKLEVIESTSRVSIKKKVKLSNSKKIKKIFFKSIELSIKKNISFLARRGKHLPRKNN